MLTKGEGLTVQAMEAFNPKIPIAVPPTVPDDAMNATQDTSHGRYLPTGHPRRHSEAVTEMSHQSATMRNQSRMMKRHRRMQADLPRHYQTAPSSSTYGAPAFNRSYSSGSTTKRPLSFIATFASKVKNAIEGWQDSSANRNSGSTLADFDSNSDSSPSLQKRQMNPRLRRTSDRAATLDRSYQYGKAPAKKTYSSGSFGVRPSFAEVEDSLSLSVPSSPEFERPTHFIGGNYYADDGRTYHSDVSNEQNRDKIKACDLTKIDGDINILVIGAEGVGKSALIVRYLTKRFIGEYASNDESIYDHAVSIDGKDIVIHIWDSGIPQMLQKSSEPDLERLDMFDISEILSMTSLNSPSRTSTSSTSSAYDNRISSSSFEEDFAVTSSSSLRLNDQKERKAGKKRKKNKKEVNNNCRKNEMDLRVHWADCVVIVYSICDGGSYESARDIVRYIRGQTVRGHAGHNNPESPSYDVKNADSQTMQIPILLIGNKADLRHRRRIKSTTAVNFSDENDCAAIELSVSEQFEAVHEAFNDIIKTIYREKFPSELTEDMTNIPVVQTASGGFTHKRNLSL